MDANDRSITLFAMLGHGTFHTYELSIPVFVAIWLDVFGTSETVLGLIVGAGLALVGVFAPVTGVLADAYGARRLVMLSILGMGGGFLALGVAPSLPVVAGALLLWGLAGSLFHPAGLSLISRGVERRGTALGYFGAAGSAGTALGPLIVLVLLVFVGWRVVAALLVLPALAALAVGWRLDFETGGAVERLADGGGGRESGADFTSGVSSPAEFLADSRLLFAGGFVLVFAIHVGYGMYFRGVFTFLPDVLADLSRFDPVLLFGRSVEPGRYLYSGLLLVGVGAQYAGGRLSDRLRPERFLALLLGALAVISLLFVPAASAGTLPLLAGCAALGIVLFLAAPVTLTLVADYAPSDLHGLSYGYVYLGLFGIGALGAAGAGVVLASADAGLLFVLLGLLAAAQAVVATVLWQRGS